MGMVVRIFTSGTSWTVPANVKKLTYIGCQGSGGNGVAAGSTSTGGAGGGGGAWASINDLIVTPGQVISYQVGTAGGTNTTWFRNTTTVLADYGKTGLTNNAANTVIAGGLAANSIGTVKYDGGNGGTRASGSNVGAGGGGGAAGPDGAGKRGGNVVEGSGGGGGGGCNGLLSTVGGATTNSDGGDGGNGPTGSGAGAGGINLSSPPSAGTNGGGGGAGSRSTAFQNNGTIGAAGSTYPIWSDSSNSSIVVGPGSGAGGSGASSDSGTGGTAGLGGGGGGCAGSGMVAGAGGNGYIVVVYDDGALTQLTFTKMLLPGTTSWTVPSKCTSLDFVGCMGPGGNGFKSDAVNGQRNGGGGGAWAHSTGIAVTPGQIIALSIPNGNDQTPTVFGSNIVSADYGRPGTSTAVGTGGAASGSIGATKYSGGSGGLSGTSTNNPGGGGGGGGAATELGDGKSGGKGNNFTGDGGGGGGGAGGPNSTVGGGFTTGSSSQGAPGGNGPLANSTGGPRNSGNISSSTGKNGGGGGGGNNGNRGSHGGAFTIYDSVVGPSGGGGGCAATAGSQYAGGNSPYGGGGGGGSLNALVAGDPGSLGGAGFIFIRYTISLDVTIEIIPAGTTSWVVPVGVSKLAAILCQGCGGSSMFPNTSLPYSNSGAGGAFAGKFDVNVVPGSTIPVVVAPGGSRGYNAAATFTSFGSGPIVRAACGQNGDAAGYATTAKGGLVSDSIGDVIYAGGDGGSGNPNTHYYNSSEDYTYRWYPSPGGGGAGGLSGPEGDAGPAGASYYESNGTVNSSGGNGGGGGGANNGSAGESGGSVTNNTALGAGGNNRLGTGRGLGFSSSGPVAPTSGIDGGGGGGGGPNNNTAATPGNGSVDRLYGDLKTGRFYGPGSGGGGSGRGQNNTSNARNTGGTPGYGAGAGGTRLAGSTIQGGDGYIVVMYESSSRRNRHTAII